jgi:hypothetical protein
MVRDLVSNAVSANTANLLRTSATDVTPTGASAFDDDQDLIRECLILLHVAGIIKVRTAEGTDVTLDGLAVGVVHPIRIKRLWSTGTDAALKVGGKVTLCYVR